MIVIPFALGEIVPALVAMGLKDWKTFQAVVSAVIASCGVTYFFVPESPRWLIANGRSEEALEVINVAAKVNKVKLTEDAFLPDQDDKTEAPPQLPVYGLKDMFRKSQLRITLAMFICWPVITMLYYGLSLSADKIHMTDNVYLSYILVSLIEMPAYIFLPLIVRINDSPQIHLCSNFPFRLMSGEGSQCSSPPSWSPGSVVLVRLSQSWLR